MNRTIIITCIAGLVVTSVIGLTYYYVHAQQQGQAVLTPVTVTYRHLVSEVNISGTAKASETVDLAFKSGGIVGTVPVSVGESVATGSVLMSLRSSTLQDRLAQAQASLGVQLAKLRDLENGTRPEQIAVTQAELASAETTLTSAEQGLLSALNSAQSAADVAVRVTIDQFIMNPMMSNSQLTIPVNDNQLSASVLDERRQVGGTLASWGTRINVLKGTDADGLLSASSDMRAYLQSILSILDGLTRILAMNNPTQSAANQATIAAARTTITSTNDAETVAEQKVRSAQAAIAVAQQQLALEKAGATNETVAAQRSVVATAQAQVAELEDELRDQRITAPFGGVVTDVSVKEGETVAAGAAAVSMISNGQLKVEGYVPEIHYREIAIGQPVRVQLDAFPGISFTGTLGLIDPAATLRDGVPNFKVTVYFLQPDSRIRPGLTASAFIETGNKTKALSVPLAAVTGSGTSATVMRLIGSASERTHVALGITGNDGYVEIVSGLAEGDSVLVNETKQYRIVPN